ncbi:hypothetical protein FOCC_FOCC016546 [Frankliniella occidentalis]|nr:hypothetical protein FOCC_FOCC016546 [Frankliniella occidentalis]
MRFRIVFRLFFLQKSPFIKKLTSPLKRHFLNVRKEPIPIRLLLDYEDGLQVKDIAGKGRGIITTRSFGKNDFVVEYKGELLTNKAAVIREKQLKDNEGSFMFFFKHKDKPLCIDATAETGHKGRLINHGVPGRAVECSNIQNINIKESVSRSSVCYEDKIRKRKQPQALSAKISFAIDRLVTIAYTAALQQKPGKQDKRHSIICSIPLKKIDMDLIKDLQCKAMGKQI